MLQVVQPAAVLGPHDIAESAALWVGLTLTSAEPLPRCMVEVGGGVVYDCGVTVSVTIFVCNQTGRPML